MKTKVKKFTKEDEPCPGYQEHLDKRNLFKCPECGFTEFRESQAGVLFMRKFSIEDGKIEWGDTDLNYDIAGRPSYECCNCYHELPFNDSQVFEEWIKNGCPEEVVE